MFVMASKLLRVSIFPGHCPIETHSTNDKSSLITAKHTQTHAHKKIITGSGIFGE